MRIRRIASALATCTLAALVGSLLGLARGPALAGSDPVLVGAGDIASCDYDFDEDTAQLLDVIDGTVATFGDNVYPNGAADEFADCYDSTWGRHKARTKPSTGNHDYHTADAAGYFDYFNGVGNFTGPAGDRDKGYYSYDLGAWHIVVINSNCSFIGGCGAGSAQEQWLRADLAANQDTVCTVAYWHHPRFSSPSLHGSQAFMQPIWQALYDYGADVVISGHDHNYQRFAPQDPTGVADPGRGIREFVVGTGGQTNYVINTKIANSEANNDDTFGVLKLTLHPTSYDWEFVPAPPGTFTDTGSAECVPRAVGGITELPEAAAPTPADTDESSGLGAPLLAGIAAGVVAGAMALAGAAWYARRRLS